MPHIFISYAKKDTRKLALALEDALNEIQGVTAWVDRSLKAGRSWELQIQTEIDRCDAMVVLYSPDINRHKQGKPESYVLTEIAYAKYSVQKLIIPVMAQQTTPPMSLTMEHYIDFTIEGLELHDLVEALCNELEITANIETKPNNPPINPKIMSYSEDKTIDGVGDFILEENYGKLKHVSLGEPTSLMPDPFDWIEIPNKGYSIAKYPVTNAQFAKFIQADGYNTQKWWTTEGWQKRLEGWHYDGEWKASGTPWLEPRYWNDSKWKGDTQPVVGVSWFEAVAFCRWLSDATGEKIMLPTEDEWQYAAQGDDGRIYPWGNDWNPALCNNNVDGKGVGKTTPVRQYEGKGDSPFGVIDMAGNVWEWCLTDYKEKTNDINSPANSRVLRGGSWYDISSINFRCADRSNRYPRNGDNDYGFRLSRS